MIYLPFDQDFKPDRPGFDNHMPLSKVGKKTSWYILVEFPPLDPQDASYPHYIELHDKRISRHSNLKLTGRRKPDCRTAMVRCLRLSASTVFDLLYSTEIRSRSCLKVGITT